MDLLFNLDIFPNPVFKNTFLLNIATRFLILFGNNY